MPLESGPVDLLIIPTSGIDVETGEPGPHGIERIDEAARLYSAGKVKAIAILGGMRASGPSEAEAHLGYLARAYPNMAAVVVICEAKACFTNADLKEGAASLNRYARTIGKTRATMKVGAVSHDCHLLQISMVLGRLGFKEFTGFSSGERPDNSVWAIAFVLATTLIDPFWEWSPPGIFLARMGNRRYYRVAKSG